MFFLFFLMSIFECASLELLNDTIIITTLSPLLNVDVPSEIGIYYHHPNFTPGDTLVLFNADPTIHPNSGSSFTYQLERPTGFVKTGHRTAPPMGLYLYSGAIVRDDKILKTSTMTDRMNWMAERKSVLEKFTIPELFIPGTHQSGAYHRRNIDDSVFNAKTITSKWTLCQDETILWQLDSGIRYLDIRPAIHLMDYNKIEYVVSHGGVEMIPMGDVVDQVNIFINTTNEIVVMSFKEFGRGFDSNEDHEKFREYLNESFSDYTYPYDPIDKWNVPLGKLWSSNRRLIIASYGPRGNSTLWPGIPQFWCNTQDIDALHGCLDTDYMFASSSTERYPHIAMVELTHDWKSIISDIFSFSDNSLRAWGDRVGPYLLKWYNEEWYSIANIVAVDFFQATGIVETAIYWNDKRTEFRS